MLLYRIAKERFARDVDGEGARRVGGRWNPIGVPLVYTSGAVAVATLEVLVHFPMSIPIPNFCLVTFEVPDEASIKTLEASDLPRGWDSLSDTTSTAEFGKSWAVSQVSLALRVPSVILPPGSWNILLN